MRCLTVRYSCSLGPVRWYGAELMVSAQCECSAAWSLNCKVAMSDGRCIWWSQCSRQLLNLCTAAVSVLTTFPNL